MRVAQESRRSSFDTPRESRPAAIRYEAPTRAQRSEHAFGWAFAGAQRSEHLRTQADATLGGSKG